MVEYTANQLIFVADMVDEVGANHPDNIAKVSAALRYGADQAELNVKLVAALKAVVTKFEENPDDLGTMDEGISIALAALAGVESVDG